MPVDRRILLVALALPATACFTTKAVSIGQKTSLERQLMGEEVPLTEEEMLASSVRARDGGVGAGSTDDLQARAIRARQRQLFNRDDVDELKAKGCLGEALSAKLERRRCEATADAATAERLERIVAEENADRAAIIDWAVSIDPILTPAERDEVVTLYHRLVVERARPGDWVQRDGGSWTQR